MTPEAKVKARVRRILNDFGVYYTMQLQEDTVTAECRTSSHVLKEGFMV